MENEDAEDGDGADPLALQTDTLDNLEDEQIKQEKGTEESQPLRRSKRGIHKTPNQNEKMLERIKRMKQRMLTTLKLSEKQLVERRQKRAQQTRESRQRTSSADEEHRQKEAQKRIARKKAHREMETPDQIELRMAKKRKEARRYSAKRRQTETEEQKAARREYQRLYMRNRQPIKF